MIIVIDYGVGNVRSVANGLAHLGFADKLTADPKEIEQAAGIILPGVAAFGFAIGQLGETGEVIKEVVRAGKPMLGICVGHQMLFEGSCEKGEHEGLGLIPGEVVEIPPGGGRTIPHMGWNSVEIPEGMDLFEGLGSEEYFYFAHSYQARVDDPKATVAFTEYGQKLTASVQDANIFGVQFHPEKSGPAGLKVMSNFAKICRNGAV